MGLHTISVDVVGGIEGTVTQAKNFVAKLKGDGYSIVRATVGHFDLHHDITDTAPAAELNTDKLVTDTGEHKA